MYRQYTALCHSIHDILPRNTSIAWKDQHLFWLKDIEPRLMKHLYMVCSICYKWNTRNKIERITSVNVWSNLAQEQRCLMKSVHKVVVKWWRGKLEGLERRTELLIPSQLYLQARADHKLSARQFEDNWILHCSGIVLTHSIYWCRIHHFYMLIMSGQMQW